MKKLILISLLIGALPLSMVAQDDDLYFVPKKQSAVEKVTDKYGLPRETYYSGSNRSVDDYNRRVSTYVPIDSALSDTIAFSGELGVYPDSLDDYQLTRKMERFEDYSLSDNAAYWAGYQDGRHDLWWHSPWYYRTYGWYNWYDPWYYTSWHYGIYDPWYYGPIGWYNGWYTGWYDPWYYDYYYMWGYPYYRYDYAYWNYGSRRTYNDHAGTIHMNRGNMNGRIYSSNVAGGTHNNAGTRLGAQRTSSLRDRTVGNHSAYTPNTTNSRTSRTAAETTRRATTTYTPSNTGGGGSIGGGGFSGGGGRASVGGGGGGGARSAGGHAGGRR